jgi:hypothetical protein
MYTVCFEIASPQLDLLDGTGWKGYDGHDMADDGVFEMGNLDIN